MASTGTIQATDTGCDLWPGKKWQQLVLILRTRCCSEAGEEGMNGYTCGGRTCNAGDAKPGREEVLGNSWQWLLWYRMPEKKPATKILFGARKE